MNTSYCSGDDLQMLFCPDDSCAVCFRTTCLVLHALVRRIRLHWDELHDDTVVTLGVSITLSEEVTVTGDVIPFFFP